MSCPETLRFWGLSPSYRLAVHSGTPTGGRFVSLRLGEKLRPSWLPAAERIRLWLDRAIPEPEGRGTVLADLEEGGRTLPAAVADEGGVTFLFDPDQAIASILNESYFEPRRPVHSYLPRAYQLVPGNLRLQAFGLLLRLRQQASDPGLRLRWQTGDAGFPAWPREPSLEVLRGAVLRAWRLATGAEELPSTLWPDGKRYALVLSHDVDTARGFAQIPEIAAVEEAHGFRSSWFVVGTQYRIDHALLDGLRQRGHEIALHGDRHDNRIAYQSPGRIERRLDACASFVSRHGVSGFRSPSLLETPTLREALRPRFRYTSDVPDSESDSLIAPRRGCASCFPFLKRGLLEIPITLPFDDKLLLSGCKAAGLLDAWRAKLAWIRAVGGLAQLLLHAEPHLWKRSRAGYERWLAERSADGEAWRANLGDVARWWLERKPHG